MIGASAGQDLLSDQLKMLYLEERDRISVVASAAAQRAAAAAGIQRPGALYSAHQRVFAAAAGPARHKSDAKFIAAPRANPLEQRMYELSRIYGSGARLSGGGQGESGQVPTCDYQFPKPKLDKTFSAGINLSGIFRIFLPNLIP